MSPFGGWLMPIQYPDGIIAEHHWTRRSVGLFDTCHMAMFAITGDAETTGLEYALTCPVSSLPVGGCRYGFMLNEVAGIVDDAVVMRLGRDDWMLVVNAANDQILGAHILAPEAGEMIQIAVLAIRFGITVQQLRETIFPYLTNAEALKLAVLGLEKDVSLLSCCAG